jgi:hypothetical protein
MTANDVTDLTRGGNCAFLLIVLITIGEIILFNALEVVGERLNEDSMNHITRYNY